MAPIVLTLALDAGAAAFFQQQRTRYFPPHLNIVPAHVTLFHHLPAHAPEHLQAACAREEPMHVRVTGLRMLGRGVAYTLLCPAADMLRARLAARFADALTRQDQAAWRPHITITNKVDPAQAGALHATLQAAFSPFTCRATGVDAWHYMGGPWSHAAHVAFAGAAAGS